MRSIFRNLTPFLAIVRGIFMGSTALPSSSELTEAHRLSPSVDDLVSHVRRFEQSADWNGYDAETDGNWVFQTLRLPKNEVALILIDVWSQHSFE